MSKKRNPAHTSFFDVSRKHLKNDQAAVLKKTGKTKALPQALAKAAHGLAEEFMANVGNQEKTACKKNCSFCCHQPATVFPFEAIHIARTLQDSLSREQLDALVVQMKDRVARFQGKSVLSNVNDKTPCPLLVQDSCSIYADRPLTCRMAHSFSVSACRKSFEGDRFKAQIPVSLGIQSGISGIIEGVYEDLPRHGLDAGLYELCSAVVTALETPDAAARWASGDRRVFAHCIKDDT